VGVRGHEDDLFGIEAFDVGQLGLDFGDDAGSLTE
jgi:hypothetical protein